MNDMKNKFKMELTWHSCETYPPEEDYNPYRLVTNGDVIVETVWRRDCGWYIYGKWYIAPKLGGRSCWWADIHQTVNKTKEFKECS